MRGTHRPHWGQAPQRRAPVPESLRRRRACPEQGPCSRTSQCCRGAPWACPMRPADRSPRLCPKRSLHRWCREARRGLRDDRTMLRRAARRPIEPNPTHIAHEPDPENGYSRSLSFNASRSLTEFLNLTRNPSARPLRHATRTLGRATLTRARVAACGQSPSARRSIRTASWSGPTSESHATVLPRAAR